MSRPELKSEKSVMLEPSQLQTDVFSIAIQGKTAEVRQPFKGKHHDDREGQHDPELADPELSLVMNQSKGSNTVFTTELSAQFPASGHMRGKHVL